MNNTSCSCSPSINRCVFISCLYFFYLCNVDILMYSYHINVIFSYFLSCFNYFFELYSYRIIILYPTLLNLSINKLYNVSFFPFMLFFSVCFFPLNLEKAQFQFPWIAFRNRIFIFIYTYLYKIQSN